MQDPATFRPVPAQPIGWISFAPAMDPASGEPHVAVIMQPSQLGSEPIHLVLTIDQARTFRDGLDRWIEGGETTA